jgi:hypothetical protein
MKSKQMAAGFLVLCLVSGCKTLPSAFKSKPTDASEITTVFSAGRDPAEFFIHRYKDAGGQTIFTGSNRQPQDTRAVLLFESPAHSVLPLVRARVPSGGEVLLLADTACQQNWTRLDLLESLGLVPVGPDKLGALPAHVLDDTPGYLCVLPMLEFDRLGVEAILIYARTAQKPFWPLPRHADARTAQMVMGMDLIRSFAYVTWDYANRMMELSSTEPYQPKPDAVLAELPISFESNLGALQISCTLDGREEAAIFDSAGNYELAMTDPALEPVRQLSLQDLVFRRVLAVTPQSVGLQAGETLYLGAALFRRYRVTLDNRKNVLWIESELPAGSVPESAESEEPAD